MSFGAVVRRTDLSSVSCVALDNTLEQTLLDVFETADGTCTANDMITGNQSDAHRGMRHSGGPSGPHQPGGWCGAHGACVIPGPGMSRCYGDGACGRVLPRE